MFTFTSVSLRCHNLYLTAVSIDAFVPRDKKYMGTRRSCHPCPHRCFYHQYGSMITQFVDPGSPVFHSVTAILWSLVYSLSPLSAIRLSLTMISRDFFSTSLIVATFLYFSSNTLLLAPPTHAAADSTRVEWAYAFDVAINSFFPCFLALGLAQLLLVSIVTRDNWVCLWVGNTLYLSA